MSRSPTRSWFIQLSEMKESRRGGLSLGLDTIREIGTQRLADEFFARFGDLLFGVALELDVELLEHFVGGESGADHVAEDGRASIPNLAPGVDRLQESIVAGGPLPNIGRHSGHSPQYSLQIHKSRREVARLQTIPCPQASGSYNTPGSKVDTKRSTPFLGNVPGITPGGNLGPARFAKTRMKRHARSSNRPIGIANANHRVIAGGRGR